MASTKFYQRQLPLAAALSANIAAVLLSVQASRGPFHSAGKKSEMFGSIASATAFLAFVTTGFMIKENVSSGINIKKYRYLSLSGFALGHVAALVQGLAIQYAGGIVQLPELFLPALLTLAVAGALKLYLAAMALHSKQFIRGGGESAPLVTGSESRPSPKTSSAASRTRLPGDVASLIGAVLLYAAGIMAKPVSAGMPVFPVVAALGALCGLAVDCLIACGFTPEVSNIGNSAFTFFRAAGHWGLTAYAASHGMSLTSLAVNQDKTVAALGKAGLMLFPGSQFGLYAQNFHRGVVEYFHSQDADQPREALPGMLRVNG